MWTFPISQTACSLQYPSTESPAEFILRIIPNTRGRDTVLSFGSTLRAAASAKSSTHDRWPTAWRTSPRITIICSAISVKLGFCGRSLSPFTFELFSPATFSIMCCVNQFQYYFPKKVFYSNKRIVITIFFYHGLMLPPVYRVSQRIVALVNNNNCYSWFID
jgi:hypothetical protein